MPRWISVAAMIAASAMVAPVSARLASNGLASRSPVQLAADNATRTVEGTKSSSAGTASNSVGHEKSPSFASKLQTADDDAAAIGRNAIADLIRHYPHNPQARDPHRQQVQDPHHTQAGAGSQCTTDPICDAMILIAVVPDPVHTHLALRFDREIDVIEDALLRQDWIYDRSWLPWDSATHKAADRWEDRLRDAREQDGLESMPGVLLFRRNESGKSVLEGGQEQPKALIVLLVGEQPTSGVNPEQFEQALNFWQQPSTMTGAQSTCGQAKGPACPVPPSLTILGPSFSGSLDSLNSLLRNRFTKAPDTLCARVPRIRIASGSVSDGYGLTRLAMPYPCVASASDPIRAPEVRSFYPNANDVVRDVVDFVKSRNGRLKVAQVSEKESRFGAIGVIQDGDAQVTIAHLHYPREISQLRRAYEQNGVIGFSKAANTPRDQLQLSISADERDGDSVETYGGPVDAVSLEAELAVLTHTLVSEDYSVALLSGTDVMDEIFVARYLSQHAPNLTVVIEDTDQLFRHRGADASLNNVYMTSSWPLLEENQSWSAPPESSQAHRPGTRELSHASLGLASAGNEGTAVALQFLLACQPSAGAGTGSFRCDGAPFPEYRSPLAGIDLADRATARPPLWLLLVEHGNFLPVALVDTGHEKNSSGPGRLNLPEIDVQSGRVTATGIQSQPGLPVKLLASAIVCLLLWHGWACYYCRLDRSASWTYALAEKQHHTIRLLVKSSLSLIGGLGLAVLFISNHPGFQVVGSFHIWLILGQVLAVSISALSIKKVFAFYDARLPWAGAAVVAGICLVGLVALDFSLWPLLAPSCTGSEHVFFLYRASRPFSGASPAMPILLITGALALCLHATFTRLAFYGHRIPQLPRGFDEVRCPSEHSLLRLTDLLANLADARRWQAAIGCVLVMLFVLVLAEQRLMVSLGHGVFDSVVTICLVLVGASVFQNLTIAWLAWRGLRQKLLIPLKQSPLRWGFTWIKGFSWQRIWRSANTLSSNQVFSSLMLLLQASSRRPDSGIPARYYGEVCALYLAPKDKDWPHTFTQGMSRLHAQMQREAEQRLASLQVEWQTDTGPVTGTDSERGRSQPMEYKDFKEPDRGVVLGRMGDEEFVALLYVGYIRMVLIQIRHRILIAAVLYILLLWSLTTYPWMYRHTILLLLIAMFAVLAATTIMIYSGMHRDDILSRTTETKTGKLDGGFFPRVLAVLGVPFLTLVASQFPEVNNVVFSWLEPSLSKLP